MVDRRREVLQRLDVLQARINADTAEKLTLLAEFAVLDRDELDPVGEFSHLEIAALWRVSPSFARSRIDLAEALTTRLPATLQALREGRIDE